MTSAPVVPVDPAGLVDQATGDPGTDPTPPRRTAGGTQGPVGMTRGWRPWALMAPALLVVAALLVWPLIWVVGISLQDYGLRQLLTGELTWVGLANYTDVLGDPYLWSTALPNTVGFAAVTVSLTLVVGTLVALLLARLGGRTRAAVTTTIMAAWALPAVTGTYVWRFAFDSGGVLSRMLGALGVIDPDTTNLFTDRWSFYAIAALNVVHHGFPFVALTVLAGLLTVPRDLTDAATMDGANAWRRFWSITFPTIRPVFAVVTILSTIWDFKVFTQIYLMPGGDGGNRDVLNLGVWSYIQSFAQNRYGYGSAIAVVLTLILLAVTLLYLRLLFREEEL